MIVKVWFFPIYFYAMRGWHHFPNTCQDLFLGGEGDIASTQNLLISFQPIICKLDYSHIIINNYCLHARWILYLYYLQIRWTSKVVHLRVVDSPLPRTSAKESNNCFIIPNQRLSRACIVHLVIKKNNWSYVKTMSCVILELRST
jgi:hypothetical protein